MRDFSTSEYTKTIGIKPDQLSYLREKKGKKSLAGFLNEIIEKHKKYEADKTL